MQKDLIYPLFGILAGWILKELSFTFKSNQETKKRLGQAIATFAYLNREMILLKNQFETFKDLADNVIEYEGLRQYTLKKYPRKTESYISQITEDIKAISQIFPFLAIELDFIINRYWFLQESKLTETSKQDSDLYLKQLSALEVGYDIYQLNLEKCVRKLCFYHSVWTWISFIRDIKRLKKNNFFNTELYKEKVDEYRNLKKQNNKE